LHAALTVLEKWGTMSFEQVSARAIEYAEHGFPMRPRTVAAIRRNLKFFQAFTIFTARGYSQPRRGDV
jgi:gamma-glutamyltranspeptidase/glutathione hydrolase